MTSPSGGRDPGPEPEEPKGGRRGLTRRQASAYQGATEAVFSILIAAGLGIWADEYFDTSPRYLLVGLVVGFIAFVTRLVRLGRELSRIADSEDSAVPDEHKSDSE